MVASALAALQRLFAAAGGAEQQHPGLLYSMNLTARDQVFRDIVQLPHLVTLMGHLLGQDYTLSDVVSLTPLPGNESQSLHRDGGSVDHVIMANCVIALVDFVRARLARGIWAHETGSLPSQSMRYRPINHSAVGRRLKRTGSRDS